MIISSVCTENLDPDVAVMNSTDTGHRTDFLVLHWSIFVIVHWQFVNQQDAP